MLFVFVVLRPVVNFMRTGVVFVAVSAVATMPTVTVAEQVHGYKQNDNYHKKPVFSYPFHNIHLTGCLLFSRIFSGVLFYVLLLCETVLQISANLF